MASLSGLASRRSEPRCPAAGVAAGDRAHRTKSFLCSREPATPSPLSEIPPPHLAHTGGQSRTHLPPDHVICRRACGRAVCQRRSARQRVGEIARWRAADSVVAERHALRVRDHEPGVGLSGLRFLLAHLAILKQHVVLHARTRSVLWTTSPLIPLSKATYNIVGEEELAMAVCRRVARDVHPRAVNDARLLRGAVVRATCIWWSAMYCGSS